MLETVTVVLLLLKLLEVDPVTGWSWWACFAPLLFGWSLWLLAHIFTTSEGP